MKIKIGIGLIIAAAIIGSFGFGRLQTTRSISPQVGGTCDSLGQETLISGAKYTCQTNVGGAAVWQLESAITPESEGKALALLGCTDGDFTKQVNSDAFLMPLLYAVIDTAIAEGFIKESQRKSYLINDTGEKRARISYVWMLAMFQKAKEINPHMAIFASLFKAGQTEVIKSWQKKNLLVALGAAPSIEKLAAKCVDLKAELLTAARAEGKSLEVWVVKNLSLESAKLVISLRPDARK